MSVRYRGVFVTLFPLFKKQLIQRIKRRQCTTQYRYSECFHMQQKKLHRTKLADIRQCHPAEHNIKHTISRAYISTAQIFSFSTGEGLGGDYRNNMLKVAKKKKKSETQSVSKFFTADKTQLLHVRSSFTISVAYWECFHG